MSIIQRVKQLNLPLGEVVVIGSGLLDAWNLRESSDVDLAVSDALYAKLRASGNYAIEPRPNDELLTSEGLEIWRDWKKDAPFELLRSTAVEVDGVRFAHPDIVLKRKLERGSPKDIKDVQLLKDYLVA